VPPHSGRRRSEQGHSIGVQVGAPDVVCGGFAPLVWLLLHRSKKPAVAMIVEASARLQQDSYGNPNSGGEHFCGQIVAGSGQHAPTR
jgi:hypothetical protein